MGAIGVPSTISFADLYGHATPGKSGSNEATDKEKASGSVVPASTKKPLWYWMAAIGMLVAARYLWEHGR